MSEPRVEILCGDCREIMAGMEAESVHCVVTSPPYLGLRDYDIPPSIWGGDPSCHHEYSTERYYREGGNSTSSALAFSDPGPENAQRLRETRWRESTTCQKCGAWLGCLGLEPTPQLYVQHLVSVFREVWRVLRRDGTCWLNLGDSYSANRSYQVTPTKWKSLEFKGANASVTPNITDALQRVMKGDPLVYRNPATVRVTAKSRGVPLQDDGFPQGVFLSLLGIERVVVKQRDNDFHQIIDTLAGPSNAWVSAPVASVSRHAAHLQIVLDAVDDLRIIISDLDPNAQPELRVVGPAARGASGYDDGPFAIEEAAEPVAKIIGDGETIGIPHAFDSLAESRPDVYVIDQAIPLGDRLRSTASSNRNLRITVALEQECSFSLHGGCDLRFTGVSHVFSLNSFGSLVSYAQLYDEAVRLRNASRPKQLLGIPWSVARALQEDGWILRSDCIWNKSNPMPESVTDRPTRAHEYVFLLAKEARYYYDPDAIREPSLPERTAGRNSSCVNDKIPVTRKKSMKSGPLEGNHGTMGHDGNGMRYDRVYNNPLGRNRRSVWVIATHPYPEAHFATFPPALVEPCILAGSRLGDTVLDPFAGSGTVGEVAAKHGRSAVLIELSREYCGLIRKRLDGVQVTLPMEGTA